MSKQPEINELVLLDVDNRWPGFFTSALEQGEQYWKIARRVRYPKSTIGLKRGDEIVVMKPLTEQSASPLTEESASLSLYVMNSDIEWVPEHRVWVLKYSLSEPVR